MGTHAWAQAILDIIRPVNPEVAQELEGDTGEGVEILTSDGNAIIDAFRKAGFEPFEQVDNLWVIESKTQPDRGITVDFREEMDFEEGHCCVVWYDDTM